MYAIELQGEHLPDQWAAIGQLLIGTERLDIDDLEKVRRYYARAHRIPFRIRVMNALETQLLASVILGQTKTKSPVRLAAVPMDRD